MTQMDSQNNLDIAGKIHKLSAAELFAEIAQAKFSGSLRLVHAQEKVIVYFEIGEVVYAVSNARKHRLFEILLAEKILSKESLVKIDGFIHDQHLGKKLIEEDLLTQSIVDSIFSIQIKAIISTVWSWEEGTWLFSPLARIKDGIRLKINMQALFAKFVKTLPDEQIIGRFKSLSESFSLCNPELDLLDIDPTPNEAFILSRIGENTLAIEEIRSLCSLPNELLYKALYNLWLKGVVNRGNWNSYFDDDAASKIAKAKFTLKTSATSFEEVEERKRAKADLEDEEAKLETIEAEKNEKERSENEDQNLPLEIYLKRVEDAATHYEMFNLSPDAEIRQIKKVYFRYAKNFHPDLFHKKVEDKKHRKIQNAFTEIAKAYDTLKNTDSRELYDFKLRKVIEAARKKVPVETSTKDEFAEHKNSNEAALQFESGYDLLLGGNTSKALPYLERASKLNPNNARYHAYFGKALAKDGSQRHRAEGQIQTAIKMEPKNLVYRMMLAELYVEIGLSTRAKGELKRLLEINPNDSDAISLLDRISNP